MISNRKWETNFFWGNTLIFGVHSIYNLLEHNDLISLSLCQFHATKSHPVFCNLNHASHNNIQEI